MGCAIETKRHVMQLEDREGKKWQKEGGRDNMTNIIKLTFIKHYLNTMRILMKQSKQPQKVGTAFILQREN